MTINRRLGLIVLAVVVTAVLLGVWYTQKKPPATLSFASGNGRIEAIEVNIATKQSGRLKEILVREGDDVSEGQVIARMDTASLSADLRQAQAQLDQAKHNQDTVRATIAQEQSKLSLAEKQVERSEQLVKKGFVSPQKIDIDRTARDSAAASLRAAKFQLEEAAAAINAAQARVDRIYADIQDASLSSPISGRVLYRLVQPGEVLSAGGNVVTLVDLTDVYMTIFLPTSQVGRVALGSEARIVLDVRKDISIPASVTFISPEAQFTPKTVETASEREKLMFRVKITIPKALLKDHAKQVKTGLPGVGYVRLDPNAAWPDSIPPLVGQQAGK